MAKEKYTIVREDDRTNKSCSCSCSASVTVYYSKGKAASSKKSFESDEADIKVIGVNEATSKS